MSIGFKNNFEKSIDNLSIRKIANKIEYSPSTIYHYFKDKEEIVSIIMRIGYMIIVNAVSITDLNDLTPTEKLKKVTRNYIQEVLKMSDEFLAVQINQSPQALKYTSKQSRFNISAENSHSKK